MDSVSTLPLRVQAGRWWFQWRGISPLPVVFLCLVVPPLSVLSTAQLGMVLFGILVAEGVRIWAVGYAGSATRTRGDTVPILVHAGPFRYVRNPLYLANILLYTLAGVAFGLGWYSLFIAAYFAVQYSLIVSYEEDVLTREFGVAYQFYAARVPRWIPSFSVRVESSAHRFDLRKALRSERATFIALLVLIPLYFIKEALQ